MIRSVLVANRGEIACRIIKTCQRLGIRAVAVFSSADAQARHVLQADEALFIGPAPASQSYLSITKLIAAAQQAAVDAIHPGYGFLAENAGLAQACYAAGILFIGPPAAAMAIMGDKRSARLLAIEAGVPLLPGYSGTNQTEQDLHQEAQKIGFPLLIKAAAGGGGKGMRLVQSAADLADGLAAARNEALKAFGSGDLLLEKALLQPRHVEMQIAADSQGNIIYLGERECSVQRRFQKVIEETPSPALSPAMREQMGLTAVTLAHAAKYQNLGTVEFLLDEENHFYFLEMNTRLQVEHPITEMVTGIDLVEWQIWITEGEPLPISQKDVRFKGHAVEARIYAENPERNFLPVIGDVWLWREPASDGIRVDSGLKENDQISPYYDPLLVKVIAHAPDRKTAVRRLIRALEKTVLLGLTTNLPFLIDLLNQESFLSGNYNTQIIIREFSDWQGSPGDLTLALLAVSLARYEHYCRQAGGRGYWRNNPNQPIRFQFLRPEESEPIEVLLTPDATAPKEFRAALGDQPDVVYSLFLHDFEGSNLDLTIDGTRKKVVLMGQEGVWWVQEGRTLIQLQEIPRLPKSRLAATSHGSLRAPMPGSVLAVLVEVGQEVESGQALIKLEAMKMEHTIRTPAPGYIEAIFYELGDNVPADAELLKIRPL